MILDEIYYFSIATEIANIVSYIGAIYDVNFPKAFFKGLSIYNGVYGMYILLIALFTRTNYRKCGIFIMIMSILRNFLWKNNPILCIIDSIICMALLIVFNEKRIKRRKKIIKNAKKELEKEIEEK